MRRVSVLFSAVLSAAYGSAIIDPEEISVCAKTEDNKEKSNLSPNSCLTPAFANRERGCDVIWSGQGLNDNSCYKISNDHYNGACVVCMEMVNGVCPTSPAIGDFNVCGTPETPVQSLDKCMTGKGRKPLASTVERMQKGECAICQSFANDDWVHFKKEQLCYHSPEAADGLGGGGGSGANNCIECIPKVKPGNGYPDGCRHDYMPCDTYLSDQTNNEHKQDKDKRFKPRNPDPPDSGGLCGFCEQYRNLPSCDVDSEKCGFHLHPSEVCITAEPQQGIVCEGVMDVKTKDVEGSTQCFNEHDKTWSASNCCKPGWMTCEQWAATPAPTTAVPPLTAKMGAWSPSCCDTDSIDPVDQEGEKIAGPFQFNGDPSKIDSANANGMLVKIPLGKKVDEIKYDEKMEFDAQVFIPDTVGGQFEQLVQNPDNSREWFKQFIWDNAVSKETGVEVVSQTPLWQVVRYPLTYCERMLFLNKCDEIETNFQIARHASCYGTCSTDCHESFQEVVTDNATPDTIAQAAQHIPRFLKGHCETDVNLASVHPF